MSRDPGLPRTGGSRVRGAGGGEAGQFPWVPRYLGTPWRGRGRDDKAGWDCLGLVEVLQPRHFALHPSSALDLYGDAPCDTAMAAQRHMARLFPQAVQRWREVPRRAGALVLLRSARVPVHCGLYLINGLFLHVRVGSGTAVGRLTDPDYRQMTPSFHVPA